MGRRRKPGPQDLAAWERVAATLRPLHPRRPPPSLPVPVPPPATAGKPPAAAVPPAEPIAPFRIGQAAPLTPAAPPRAAMPKIDVKLDRRLRRGRQHPEASIDLHGRTLAEAHRALAAFLGAARAGDLRLVLVITGKGSGGPASGALRRQVPIWLDTPPIAALVRSHSEAHQRHGGAGARYVALRRR